MAKKREMIIKKEILKRTKLREVGSSPNLARGNRRTSVGDGRIRPTSFDGGSDGGRGGGGG